jgi:hypothetical protein
MKNLESIGESESYEWVQKNQAFSRMLHANKAIVLPD